MPPASNLFATPAGQSISAEFFETLAEGSGTWKLERILSFAQPSPEGFWYDQEADEWVLLVRGTATLEIENQAAVHLIPGDHLFLPARRRHRVSSVSADAVWLALHHDSSRNPWTPPPDRGLMEP